MPHTPRFDAYTVLGVPETVTELELRQAYRRMLRATHPDLGGDTARFHAVQEAWRFVGEPLARARYDTDRAVAGRGDRTAASARPARPARSSQPRHAAPQPEPGARAHGHPGGSERERYLRGLRRWLDVPALPPNPYAPEILRSVPRDLKELYLRARAEERTAVALAALDARHSFWNDVAVPGRGGESIDHLVLGPSGLFAAFSETWPVPVLARRGEVFFDGVPRGARLVRDRIRRVRSFMRALDVRVAGVLLVVADDPATAQEVEDVSSRPFPCLLVPRSRLTSIIRSGIPGAGRGSHDETYALREQLARGIVFA